LWPPESQQHVPDAPARRNSCRGPLADDGAPQLLEQCPEGGNVRDVLEWAAHLPEVNFADGAQILVEGHRHHELLILVEGTLAISKSGSQISIIDQPGAILGEMAFLLDTPATATVTALGDCRFLRSDDPETLLRDRPGLALEIAVTLARRLDMITGYLADLRNQYGDRSDHLGVIDEVLESLMQNQGQVAEPGSERESDAPY
jgi:CRP/FNR family transcriptional regulator, cyclic AMP receptor protein